MNPKLPVTGHYTAKDQAKSDRATCFIGRGSIMSSTHRYMRAWGQLANKTEYSPQDIVFISAEGNRKGRLPPHFDEIAKACEAGARIITDLPEDRQRAYNAGEREVALFLAQQAYREVRPGQWVKRQSPSPA